MDAKQNKLKQLDLLGGLGAAALGAGLALLFADQLKLYAVPGLLIGILAHSYAMFAKGRLERQAKGKQPKWAIVAEWACWFMLSALLFYVVAGLY